MSLVKVSVESLNGKDKRLHQLDKSKSLDENIQSVCELFDTPTPTSSYSLKSVSTNDGKKLDAYISEENFVEVRDGYFLKLVYSVKYYADTIFDHLTDNFKEKSFEDLYSLSVEPEFIKELVKRGKHLLLMEHFTRTNVEETDSKEITACLITLMHLMIKNYLADIDSLFLEKVIAIIKAESTPAEQAKYALSVLQKILVNRNPNFAKWKEEVIRQVPITDLTPYIWQEDHSDVQYGALLVINSLIKSCRGEVRYTLIKEMNQKKNRELIYKYLIENKNFGKEKSIPHQLYVYQTYCLSKYAEALNSTVNINDHFFGIEEFEIKDDSEVKRMTVLMDFDDNVPKTKFISLENLLELDENTRISLASISSKYSENYSARTSGREVSSVGSITTVTDHTSSSSISVLTVEALRHYKKHHYKNFSQSLIEENFYEPGIFISSEKIIRMLAKILHIGNEPDRHSSFYQPILFHCHSAFPFFEELFSRTMWLLSKTRREMKASTINDYTKVLNVLEQQVKLVLHEKPINFKMLTEKMVEITYETVMKKWQKNKEDEINDVIQNNASVQTLRQEFTRTNEELVYEQRMRYLEKGTLFPKIVEKKIIGNFKAKLSSNRKELIIYDYNVSTRTKGPYKIYPISSITHIVEGKACPHVINNAVKEPYLAFSILVQHSEYVNFKAHDKKMASYWLDALNLLLGKDNRSELYKAELAKLVKMDLVLHLIDLQDVKIPKNPPPVPPPPTDLRPALPPKPSRIRSQNLNF